MAQHFVSKYLPEENRDTNLKRYMHPHIHCNIIYNGKDMETTSVLSANEWIKKM